MLCTSWVGEGAVDTGELLRDKRKEILALAVEMEERLKGTWQTTPEDEELQRRFWSLFNHSPLHGTLMSHIGAEFLRNNRELLEPELCRAESQKELK